MVGVGGVDVVPTHTRFALTRWGGDRALRVWLCWTCASMADVPPELEHYVL